MRYIALLIVLTSFAACTRERSYNRVEIYLLRSFTHVYDTTIKPGVSVIRDPVLESSPLVNDHEIKSYTKADAIFKLSTDINDRLKNLGPDKGFAVTLDGDPVYYGTFHPGYMSSVRLGIATIDPLFTHDQLLMNYVLFSGGNPNILQQLDKRNDPALLAALQASGRLR